jgi:hypothetical protein
MRLFANCENSEIAGDIAARVSAALVRLSPQQLSPPKRYWKLPELFEFNYTLSPANEASFQAVLAMVSGGWAHSDVNAERSSVWSRVQDHILLAPEVSWAEVQLFEAAP